MSVKRIAKEVLKNNHFILFYKDIKTFQISII